MAREAEITRRVKFFIRKRNCDDSKLCNKCKHHKYLLMVRFGCDALVYTNTRAKSLAEVQKQAQSGIYVHLWCTHKDDPPSCIEQFRAVGAL